MKKSFLQKIKNAICSDFNLRNRYPRDTFGLAYDYKHLDTIKDAVMLAESIFSNDEEVITREEKIKYALSKNYWPIVEKLKKHQRMLERYDDFDTFFDTKTLLFIAKTTLDEWLNVFKNQYLTNQNVRNSILSDIGFVLSSCNNSPFYEKRSKYSDIVDDMLSVLCVINKKDYFTPDKFLECAENNDFVYIAKQAKKYMHFLQKTEYITDFDDEYLERSAEMLLSFCFDEYYDDADKCITINKFEELGIPTDYKKNIINMVTIKPLKNEEEYDARLINYQIFKESFLSDYK